MKGMRNSDVAAGSGRGEKNERLFGGGAVWPVSVTRSKD